MKVTRTVCTATLKLHCPNGNLATCSTVPSVCTICIDFLESINSKMFPFIVILTLQHG